MDIQDEITRDRRTATTMETRTIGLSDPMIITTRRLYTQDTFDSTYETESNQSSSMLKRAKRNCQCSKETPWKLFSTYLPIVRFIHGYDFKANLLGDFLSGLTVSFMHFPQAMGFGILASLRPEHGLYTTFFPVVVYLLFGTSPHISFGTNAVMALLTQAVVDKEAETFAARFSVDNTSSANSTVTSGPTEDQLLAVKVNAAAVCCVLSGAILAVMGLLRFGVLTTYMSDSFIGGFTTAASIHICTSQVPKLFGIKVVTYVGAGKLVLTYIDLFRKLGQTVIAEVIIGATSMIILLIVKICINERCKSKMKMPIPIDLIVVIVGTFISYIARFRDVFSVAIVGPIPSGFSSPSVPNFENAGNHIGDAIIMAILSLAMSIALAKLMSKQHNIEIDDNQELIAYGAGNLVSGFFSCFPAATAPPRTMILSSLGAKTTLNGIVTAVFMLLVILVLGQLFVSLPLSVLAAMIIVSMKDLLLQYRNVPSLWRINRYDCVIWLVTNLVGVLVDLNYGLFAGIGISILLVIVQSQFTSGQVLVHSQNEDIYIDSCSAKSKQKMHGINIFKFNSSLYFATAERFKSQLYRMVQDPKQVNNYMTNNQCITKSHVTYSDQDKTYITEKGENTNEEIKEAAKLNFIVDTDDKAGDPLYRIHAIILDCSAMNYIDIAGKNILLQIIKEYKVIGVDLFFAGLPVQGQTLLEAAGVFNMFPRDRLFIAVQDAVESIRLATNKSEDVNTDQSNA